MSFSTEIIELLKPAKGENELGRLDQYIVNGILGEGGMGVVLDAFDTQLKRKVAIKVLPPVIAEQPIIRLRFIREAQAMAALDSDYVVPIYHIVDNYHVFPVPFFVMPLLRGKSLHAKLEESKQLSFSECMHLIRGLCAGLYEAHQSNIVHRDIKPSNIWLETVRNSEHDLSAVLNPSQYFRVKLLDFGVARPLDASQITGFTQYLGSPAYSSPEQFLNQSVDSRSDLFSVGIVLFEAITGQHPFISDFEIPIAEVRKLIREKPAPTLRSICPDFPNDALATCIDRLLSKSPEQRPADIRELLRICVRSTGELVNILNTGEAPSSYVTINIVPAPKTAVHVPTPPSLPESPFPGTFEKTAIPQVPNPGISRWWLVALAISILNCLLLALLIAEGLGLIPTFSLRRP